MSLQHLVEKYSKYRYFDENVDLPIEKTIPFFRGIRYNSRHPCDTDRLLNIKSVSANTALCETQTVKFAFNLFCQGRLSVRCERHRLYSVPCPKIN